MRGKKKNLIVVTYGFHPQEYFAEEVGKRIGEMNLENVVSLKFTPKCMPENFNELYGKDIISYYEKFRLDRAGSIERANFLRNRFPDMGFCMDLHDTYKPRLNELQISLRIISKNRKLKKFVRPLKKCFGSKLELEIDRRWVYAGRMFNEIDLDFLVPKIEGEEQEFYFKTPKFLEKGEVKELLNEATDFTSRLINWVKQYYLNPHQEFLQVSLLYQ